MSGFMSDRPRNPQVRAVACKRHAGRPAIGYNACPGCEIEDLRDKIRALEKLVLELQKGSPSGVVYFPEAGKQEAD